MYALEISELTVGYRKRAVLKELSLSVEQGRMVAIVGQNGAGKSTLIKTVMGLLPPAEGKIKLYGVNVTYSNVKDRVEKGIYCFMQGGKIFPSLSVQENLFFAGHTLAKGPLESSIQTILQLISPDKGQQEMQGGKNWQEAFLRKRASNLSGGERHKLAMAMVLLNSPRLLLLDEPSAGLSPQDARKLYDILNAYRKEYQTTIVLVEQNVKLAAENSDDIHLLLGGGIFRSAVCHELKSEDGNVDTQKLDSFFF